MHSLLQRHIAHLSITIGERHLGSAGEREAQEYLASTLRSYGYDVFREPFATPGWRYEGHCLSTSRGEVVESVPCFFSPGGEITAPLRLFTPGLSRSEEFAGAIAFAGYYDFRQVHDTNSLAEALEQAGAAAFIINSPYNDTYSTKIVRSPNLRRMPVVTLSQRAALKLAREEGRNVHLTVNATTFEHESANIIGRHTAGNGRKLVLGAHYDTSPGIPGAVDNASGVAVLLHLAQTLRPHLDLTAWDVDFVAFGGEEYGGPGYGIGGYNYYHTHAGEPIEAMICLDGLGSYLAPTVVRIGRSRKLRRLAAETCTASRAAIHPFKAGSDQGIFHQHNIPTAWFAEDGPTNGVRNFPLHSPQDAIDLIDFRKLTAIAEDAGRFVARILSEGLDEPSPDLQGTLLPLEANDHPEVLALVKNVWSVGMDARREKLYGKAQGAPWQEKIATSVADYLREREVRGFKIMAEGKFAGFLAYRLHTAGKRGEIGYNAIDPAFAGRGMAQRLLQAALKELKQAGAEHVEVVTGQDDGHAPARAVYEGAGFRAMHQSILYTMAL